MSIRKTEGEIAPLPPMSTTPPSRLSTPSGGKLAQSSIEISSSSTSGAQSSLSSGGESSRSSEGESFISSEVLCSSVQAAVYISMMRTTDELCRVFDWFLLDDKSQEKSLYPILESQPGCDLLSCVTAFGSAIYVLGGFNMTSFTHDLSSDVYYVDTCKPGEGWKKGASLLKPRGFAYAGVMNGKIYIWGGSLMGDVPRTGEVFDPTLNSWSELQHHTLDMPPPSELHAVWEDKNRFLFQSPGTKNLYVYDAAQDSWALYDSSYGWRSNQAAVVGEIMYVFHKGEVHAYDLDKRKWFKKAVANLRNQVCLPPAYGPLSKKGTLLHLGNGRLCLIWDQDVGDLKHVHCIKFAVCKERYEHRVTLVASAVSSSVFYIKGDRILESCLALEVS